ncbi:MAG: hypothetical protein JST16_11860 [Bdellovibrionales bacterium]|nr:hypothetical protein [Bdellovibrionales bacterium]
MNNYKKQLATLSLTLIASVFSSTAMAQLESMPGPIPGLTETSEVQMLNGAQGGAAAYGRSVNGSVMVNDTQGTIILNLTIANCPVGSMCFVGPRYLSKEFIIDNEFYAASGARHLVGHLNTGSVGVRDTIEVVDFRSSRLRSLPAYMTLVKETMGALAPMAPQVTVLFGGKRALSPVPAYEGLLVPSMEGVVTESVEN